MQRLGPPQSPRWPNTTPRLLTVAATSALSFPSRRRWRSRTSRWSTSASSRRPRFCSVTARPARAERAASESPSPMRSKVAIASRARRSELHEVPAVQKHARQGLASLRHLRALRPCRRAAARARCGRRSAAPAGRGPGRSGPGSAEDEDLDLGLAFELLSSRSAARVEDRGHGHFAARGARVGEPSIPPGSALPAPPWRRPSAPGPVPPPRCAPAAGRPGTRRPPRWRAPGQAPPPR